MGIYEVNSFLSLTGWCGFESADGERVAFAVFLLNFLIFLLTFELYLIPREEDEDFALDAGSRSLS